MSNSNWNIGCDLPSCPELLKLASRILNPTAGEILVLADPEHFSAELLDQIHAQTRFDLLVPMPNYPSLQKQLQAIPVEQFTRWWAPVMPQSIYPTN